MKNEILEEYKVPHVGTFTIFKGQFTDPKADGISIMKNGCGVGGGHTGSIEDARQFIYISCLSTLSDKERKLSESLAEIRSAYNKLKKDHWNLGLFIAKHQ